MNSLDCLSAYVFVVNGYFVRALVLEGHFSDEVKEAAVMLKEIINGRFVHNVGNVIDFEENFKVVP